MVSVDAIDNGQHLLASDACVLHVGNAPIRAANWVDAEEPTSRATHSQGANAHSVSVLADHASRASRYDLMGYEVEASRKADTTHSLRVRVAALRGTASGGTVRSMDAAYPKAEARTATAAQWDLRLPEPYTTARANWDRHMAAIRHNDTATTQARLEAGHRMVSADHLVTRRHSGGDDLPRVRR
jgi:DNA-binding IclR family transcriptional regulator